MSVRMRHTRAHTANRRSHHALIAGRLSTCSNCKAMKARHQMCSNCGMYRGRIVVDVKAGIAKKEDKRKAKLSEAQPGGAKLLAKTGKKKEDKNDKKEQ